MEINRGILRELLHVYTLMPLFTQKYDESKKLRTIRLTDTAWEALERIAKEQGLDSRTDLLEQWARGGQASKAERQSSTLPPRDVLENYIKEILEESPKRAIKVSPQGAIEKALRALVEKVASYK